MKYDLVKHCNTQTILKAAQTKRYYGNNGGVFWKQIFLSLDDSKLVFEMKSSY